MTIGDIVKNSLSTNKPGQGLSSLRKTRTSEVSSFVKNYNLAQTRAMRREVEIWHKDTRYALRSMNGRQHKLYSSLLKLSKTKKMIKIQREEQSTMETEKPRKQSGIQTRKRNRRNLQNSGESSKQEESEVLKLDEEDENYVEDELQDSGDGAKMNHEDQIPFPLLEAMTRNFPLTKKNLLQFNQNVGKKSSPRYTIEQNESEELGISKLGNIHKSNGITNTTEKNKEPKYDVDVVDKVIDTVRDAQQGVNISNERNKSSIPMRKEHLSEGNHKLQKNELALTDAHIAPSNDKLKVKSKYSDSNRLLLLPQNRPKHVERLKNTKFNALGKIVIPEEREELKDIHDECKLTQEAENLEKKEQKENSKLPTVGNNASRQINIQTDNSHTTLTDKPSSRKDEERSRVDFRQRRGRRRRHLAPALKPPSDPSEELNQTSSLQIKEGRTYNLTIYKKDLNGNLIEETAEWDTTVDVAKYFHLASHRDRLTRRKLLEDARFKEQQQRQRVGDFLSKLAREEEQAIRARDQRYKQNEDAQLALQRRIESMKKGPPKYGIVEDATTPGYVRQYVRQSKEERIRARGGRKRSSWCLPSLFTLSAGIQGSNSLSSSLNSGKNSHYDSKRYLGEMTNSSSHLVNINIEKYIIQAAAQ